MLNFWFCVIRGNCCALGARAMYIAGTQYRIHGTNAPSSKAEWPDWYPPAEMLARQPYLPRMTSGGHRVAADCGREGSAGFAGTRLRAAAAKSGADDLEQHPALRSVASENSIRRSGGYSRIRTQSRLMIAIVSLFVRMVCDCFKSRLRLDAELLVLRNPGELLRLWSNSTRVALGHKR